MIIRMTFDNWYDNAMQIWRDKRLNAKNLKEYFDDLFEDFVKNDTNEIRELKKAIFKSYQSYLCIYISCNSLSECSLSELGSFILFPGPDEEFPGGYSTLLQHLALKLPQNSIKLNHPVDRITVEGDYVKVECYNKSIFYCLL